MSTLNPQQFAEHSYHKTIEMVPTHVLDRFKEYDREVNPNIDLDEFTEDVRQRGIQQPVMLLYGQHTRDAYLGEGNHRLAAAKRLGITEVPTRVLRQSRNDERGKPVPGFSREHEEQHHGHVPADLKPSQIGLPGRHWSESS